MVENFNPVTRKSNLILVALIAIVFLAVSLIASLEKALAFAVAFGALFSVIQTRRQSWADHRFWVIMGILAIIHVVVLSLIHIPELSAGIIVLPFVLVDAFAIWGFLNWFERRFPAATYRP